MQDRFWKIIKKSCQMHRKVEENLANIEKPSSIYGTVEDMVNRAGEMCIRDRYPVAGSKRKAAGGD